MRAASCESPRRNVEAEDVWRGILAGAVEGGTAVAPVVVGGTMRIENCTVVGNRTPQYVVDGNDTTVVNTIFAENTVGPYQTDLFDSGVDAAYCLIHAPAANIGGVTFRANRCRKRATP